MWKQCTQDWKSAQGFGKWKTSRSYLNRCDNPRALAPSVCAVHCVCLVLFADPWLGDADRPLINWEQLLCFIIVLHPQYVPQIDSCIQRGVYTDPDCHGYELCWTNLFKLMCKPANPWGYFLFFTSEGHSPMGVSIGRCIQAANLRALLAFSLITFKRHYSTWLLFGDMLPNICCKVPLLA